MWLVQLTRWLRGDGVSALSHSSDALIGAAAAAAAREEQSPHAEYHFTVNEMMNEGCASLGAGGRSC